jgi:hypothetical protein
MAEVQSIQIVLHALLNSMLRATCCTSFFDRLGTGDVKDGARPRFSLYRLLGPLELGDGPRDHDLFSENSNVQQNRIDLHKIHFGTVDKEWKAERVFHVAYHADSR